MAKKTSKDVIEKESEKEQDSEEDTSSALPKEKSIYVKVSDEIRDIIDKYKNKGITISSIIEDGIIMYDLFNSMGPEARAIIDRDGQDYEQRFEVIEEAVSFLEKEEDPEKMEDLELWCRARQEMSMMLIGKTTFNQMIHAAETPEDSIEKPQKKNIALDVILWLTKKPLSSLSLIEILEAIKKMWVVSNYFYLIDINELEKDTYNILMKHHQNKRYSQYWLGYFQTLFNYLNDKEDVAFKCYIEGQAFDETISLTIKELYEKN